MGVMLTMWVSFGLWESSWFGSREPEDDAWGEQVLLESEPVRDHGTC